MSDFDGFDSPIAGVLHWSAPHPRIGQVVHSYLVEDGAVAIDPVGADGLVEALAERGGVELVVLTCRHHYRGAGELVEAFGCPVRCPEPGTGEFERGPAVDGFRWGEELAPGIVAHEVDAISPDDGALLIERGPGALALADSVIGWDRRLSFVPDSLMDEPERTKAGLLDSLRRLCELDFEALLLAHGEPIAAGGREALAAFVEDPRQADFSA